MIHFVGNSVSDDVLFDIETKIINDEYKSGEKLPSVRQLIKLYDVSNVTMQNILKKISDKQLISIKRQVGYFVTDNNKIIENYKQKLLREITLQYLEKLSAIDIRDFHFIEQILITFKRRKKYEI